MDSARLRWNAEIRNNRGDGKALQAARLMAQGEILWFDDVRGFGFIRPDMGPKDVFMHVSALAEAGVEALPTGTRVEFELVQTGDGRLTAQRVLPVEEMRGGKRGGRRR